MILAISNCECVGDYLNKKRVYKGKPISKRYLSIIFGRQLGDSI